MSALDDLERISAGAEDRAFAWIEANFATMDPFAHRNRDRFEFCVKVLAELAFVLARDRFQSNGPARRIAQRAFDAIYRDAGFQSFLLQHLGKLPGLSLTASLAAMGLEDIEFRRRLRDVALPATVTNGEYGPAIFMDIAHSAVRCGLDWTGPSVLALLDQSLLGALPDLSAASDADYYAITHSVFFCTDFGRSPESLPAHIARYLFDVFERVAFEVTTRANWDLLGEFLMCLRYAALPRHPSEASYLAALLGSQLEDGSFRNSEPVDDEPEWSSFVEKYHTTFVALLAIDSYFGAAARPVHCAGSQVP